MTVDEIQVAIMENQAATTRLICACQLRAAQNMEELTATDLKKSTAEMEASVYIAEKAKQQSNNYTRPSLMFRPALSQEDGMWVCTYGDMKVTGPTPETAHQEFDRQWVGKDEL